MKTFAVLLSGCGVYDGSEIYETVCTLMALEKFKVKYQCVAPDILQHHVINHLTGQEMPQQRHVLIESARLARGNVKSLAEVTEKDFAGLLVPGGFGAAKNLGDFAFKGKDMSVEPSVLAFCQSFAKAHKPAGFICIAPSLIAKIYGPGVRMTIGKDPETAATMEAMGDKHLECEVNDCVADPMHKVVSTPAFMLAKSILEAQAGIEKCVKAVIDWS
jgi:enhancing lycopene biosynthesis protein 2